MNLNFEENQFNTNHPIESIQRQFVKAVQKGNIALVKSLIEAGVDIHFDADWALQMACRRNDKLLIKSLLEWGATPRNNNSLYFAVSYCDLEIVNLLLEKGADPRFNDSEAIKAAEYIGNDDMLRALVRKRF